MIYEEYKKQGRQARLNKEMESAVAEGNITGAKLSKHGSARLYSSIPDIFNKSFETDRVI